MYLLGFATFNTIAASPQLGFGIPPTNVEIPYSFLDMHGLEDTLIPMNLDSAYGASPSNGLMSNHGSYFEDKETYLKAWAEAIGTCDAQETLYETPFDGEKNLQCWQRKCSGNSIVRCFGDWGHQYPVAENKKYITAEIGWKFMAEHPRGGAKRVL